MHSEYAVVLLTLSWKYTTVRHRVDKIGTGIKKRRGVKSKELNQVFLTSELALLTLALRNMWLVILVFHGIFIISY